MYITKARVITISILLIGYLLLSANQLSIDPTFRPKGEMEIEYTTPIDQNLTYSVERKPAVSMNSHIVLNTSDIDYHGNFPAFQLPRFDYDRIVFNVSLESTSSVTAVTFAISYSGVGVSLSEDVSELSVVSIELNVSEIKEQSAFWLVDLNARISPIDSLIIHNLIVWVYSSVPLVPVSIDLQTTNGQSLFESTMFRNLWHRPNLRLYKDNNTSNIGNLYPREINHTFYVRPGMLNGTARWEPEYYNSFPLNVLYFSNESVLIKVRLLAINVELDVNTSYPITHIYISGYNHWTYDLYVSPDLMPPSLYIPPDYEVYITVSLSEISNNMQPLITSSLSRLNLNGSYNLRAHVDFNSPTFGGFEFTTDFIRVILTLTLFLLVLLRLSLFINNPKRKIPKDFRLIPSISFGILSLLPWFYNTNFFPQPYQEFTIPIHSISMGPFPLVGFWTDGSSIAWTVTSETLVWSIVAIALYWLPVLGTAIQFSTPSNRLNDIKMGILLFIPSNLILFVYLGLESIVGGFGNLVFPLAIGLIIPTAWLFLICVISIAGKYKTVHLQSLLSRDMVATPELKEIIETKSEKDSPVIQNPQDYDTWRGWFVLLLLFLLILIPYALTPNGLPFFPLPGLYYIGNMWDYSHLGLAFLLIEIPYLMGGFLAIHSMWRFSRRKVSIVWVWIGAGMLYLFTIPGIMLLGFTAFPLPAIIFVSLSILLWFKQAYEDAGESEIVSDTAKSDAFI